MSEVRGGVHRLLALLIVGVALLSAASGAGAATRPNIVFVLTDDQRFDTLGAMPTVQRDLVGTGRHVHERVRRERPLLPESREHPDGPLLALHQRLRKQRPIRRLWIVSRPLDGRYVAPVGGLSHGLRGEVPERLQTRRTFRRGGIAGWRSLESATTATS